MTKQEQIQFVKDLSARIEKEFIERINAGVIPEEFGARELRKKFEDITFYID